MKAISVKANLKLLPILCIFNGGYFHVPIIILLINSITGTMTLTMALITTEAFTTSLLDIPTGIMSDKIGRRKTIILAGIFDLLPAVIYIFALLYNQIYLLFIATMFQGFARALYKGTDTSLLYETLDTLNKKEKYHEYYGIIKSFWQVGILIPVILSSVLGTVSFLYGLIFLSIYKAFGTITTFFIAEPKIKIDNSVNCIGFRKYVTSAFKKMISNKKVSLLSILGIMDHITESVTHNLQNIYFKMLAPIWLVGILKGIKHFLGAVGFIFAKTVIKKMGYIKSYANSVFTSTAFQTIALFLNNIFSPFIMVIQNFFFSISNTVGNSLMQQEYSDQERATMASMYSFAKTIVFGIASLAFGYITDIYGIMASLYMLAGLKLLVWIILKKQRCYNNNI